MKHSTSSGTLADVLELILDKGIVICGDIGITLVGVELLTIKLRVIVASVDKAREMGIRWWEVDPALSLDAERLRAENAALQARLGQLEAQMARLLPAAGAATGAAAALSPAPVPA